MLLTVRVSSYLEWHMKYAIRGYSKTCRPGVPRRLLMNSVQRGASDFTGFVGKRSTMQQVGAFNDNE